MTAEPSTWTSHRWTWGLIVMAGLAAAGAYHFWPSKKDEASPQDNGTSPEASAPLPSLTESPFLNTRPGVAFVGDQRCVSCHRDQSRSYRQHSMGRSMYTAADSPRVESYGAGSDSHFQDGPFHFQSVRQGNRLIQREWCQDAGGNVVAAQEIDIDYAIGSGAHGYSYLWQRDGFIFQSPISWFSTDSKWRLSPGYQHSQYHFTRPAGRRCLYCHSDEAYHVDGTINRYRDPPFRQMTIGCERCHGPGELHVASRLKGPLAEEVDRTIVNPKHLSPVLREAVCEQCHLQGDGYIARRGRAAIEYRPGLPPHEYFTVFVKPELEGNKVVSHVEQMHQSACFKKSAGNFGCTSCHDPHGLPSKDEAVAHYRERCTDCHSENPSAKMKPRTVRVFPCSVPLERRRSKNGDNCIACHMPSNPSSNISHAALSDHRVLRKPDRRPRNEDAQAVWDLVPFHRDSTKPDDPELQRDQGIAMMSRVHQTQAEDARTALCRRALELLDEAAQRAPDDLPALEARADALFELGYRDEALQTVEKILAKSPHDEQSLAAAALLTQMTDKLDKAEAYGRRLLQEYPQSAAHHARMASIYAARKAWPDSVRSAEQSLRLNPFDAQARGILIIALLENDQRDRAMTELKTLEAIDPAHRQRIWAEIQSRPSQK